MNQKEETSQIPTPERRTAPALPIPQHVMKRSYEESTGSTASSTHSSPPAGDASPTYPRKRRSTSPGPLPPLAPPPAPSAHNPIASLFTDASGRITRIPTISRKVRACAACKKQKIRCDFEDGEQTCVRCKKMKLECVVNRSLQTILDEDIEFVSPAPPPPPAYCPMERQKKRLFLRPLCSPQTDTCGTRERWKHKMREDTVQLQRAVEDVLASLNMRQLTSYCSNTPPTSRPSSEPPNSKAQALPPLQIHQRGAHSTVRFQDPPSCSSLKLEDDQQSHRGGLAMAREHSQAPDESDGQSLFSNPMGSLYEVTRLRGLRGCGGTRFGAQADEMEVDFISRGLLSESDAQELFTVYRPPPPPPQNERPQTRHAWQLTRILRFRDNLNQYLYNIALVHDDLESARVSSSLLTAAIFTVTALHVPQHHHLFPLLYQEFLVSVSTCMFNRSHRLDDVRGLCIGAFWLMDVSWKLSGHAVRIATEMNIHQAFGKAVSGSSQHFEQARLWCASAPGFVDLAMMCC